VHHGGRDGEALAEEEGEQVKDNHSNSDHVETDTEKRWEQGIPHHPESEKIFAFLRKADEKYDFFDWKAGGDGDNGEELMYALDVYFDLKDRENKESKK
jgi:hypothetical protein